MLVAHDHGCKYARPDTGGHSDAAKRVSDQYNLHLIGAGDQAKGMWLAVALADGRSDGVLYASRRAAVAFQHHNEQWYAFVRIMPTSMSTCAAEAFLRMHRLAYDAGFRLSDPEAAGGGYDIVPRITAEEHQAQIAALASRVLPLQRIG